MRKLDFIKLYGGHYYEGFSWNKRANEQRDFEFAEKQSEKFDNALGELTGKILEQGMTPKDAIGLSSGYLENVYAQAYRLYNTGKYAEATHLFRILNHVECHGT